MPRNTLSDLNNHLFAQLERLADEELNPEQLKMEAERTKAINDTAKSIIANARTSLWAIKVIDESLPQNKPLPDQFKQLKEPINTHNINLNSKTP